MWTMRRAAGESNQPPERLQHRTTVRKKMFNSLRSWMMFAALLVCVLVCLSSFTDAYPPKPETPGSNASPEDWASYQAAVRHYVNLITRQRYGKRSSPEEAVAWLLFKADPSQDIEPRLDDDNAW